MAAAVAGLGGGVEKRHHGRMHHRQSSPLLLLAFLLHSCEHAKILENCGGSAGGGGGMGLRYGTVIVCDVDEHRHPDNRCSTLLSTWYPVPKPRKCCRAVTRENQGEREVERWTDRQKEIDRARWVHGDGTAICGQKDMGREIVKIRWTQGHKTQGGRAA